MDVLFIEDDTIEIMKLQRTVSKIQLRHNIIEAKNREQASETLKPISKLPDIILLNLNTPHMSGIKFLEILKADPNFKHLPTIILTQT